VRINAVLPGMIDTRMLRSIVTTLAQGDTEAGLKVAAAAAPVNRPGSAEEVAAVVVFLASDQASFVNGAGWPVDGGVLATIANGG
jgi:3alpha(or 20beta)-hydroxysteroid dehydrogenase